MLSAVLNRAAVPLAQRAVLLAVLLLSAFAVGLVARRLSAPVAGGSTVCARAALLLYPLLGPPFAGALGLN